MPRLLFALLLLCSAATAASAAAIYKYVDKDGHVTFTDVPLRGAHAIQLTPATTAVRPATPRSRNPRADSGPAHIPPVDSGTQRQRDAGRRRILQTELDNEQRALGEARQSLQDAGKKAGTPPAQLQRLRDAVTDRERNIAALKQELGNAN
ncbi:DUF4124 domain-containing protein [Vogesella fluminis]|uniref:DUF4124 domain-containing protein n=1 Tax=Vogesella fluminis TaxID=1069161 RepID=A0ABQ3H6D1_9NEIS|nr:DUF4124 domain-containing protein [Vogesella fluminis]GHD71831.1 hypothetical protein GCM10011419_04090 [Vogesella fluminis]